MKTLFYSLMILIFTAFNVNAQESETNVRTGFCGTDEIHKEKIKNDASYRLRHLQTLENIQRAQSVQARTGQEEVLRVPVVVHIMHLGEYIGVGTNVSDDDVIAGLKHLNDQWRNKGVGNGVDMKIEFALALWDENGNCTNGIVRKDMSAVTDYVTHGVIHTGNNGIDDYNSDPAVNSLREYSKPWDPTRYYNVYFVNDIQDAGGYANFATTHGEIDDGAVMLTSILPNDPDNVWSHEMGHAFNLDHTFNGDIKLDGTFQCGDDGIDDTPKHIRSYELSIGCGNTDKNDCDPGFDKQMSPTHKGDGTHQDHVRNYMDYSDCRSEFTSGQKTVARSALMNERKSFLPENGNNSLLPPMVAKVDFSASGSVVCIGSSITFTDQTTCIPSTFNWTFNNGEGTIYNSTDHNPTITFDHPGTYDVTLEVTNSYGKRSLTKSKSIIVPEVGVRSGCSLSTFLDHDFGCGVTNISFNTLNNSTSTFVPKSSMQDFACSKGAFVYAGSMNNLNVTYKSKNYYQYLEVWIDWDNSGKFETYNSNGINERVLTHSINPHTIGTPSATITPPATATLNKLLRMRVISSMMSAPSVCGQEIFQRADDYGILVVVQGCTDNTRCNYNASATYDDDSCLDALDEICESCSLDADGNVLTDGSGTIVDNDDDDDGVCDADEVVGCQEATACNYNSSATDAGTCTHATGCDECSGATDGTGVVVVIEDKIIDCESGQCFPTSWIANGSCDDGTWGVDLTCYANDGGDCVSTSDTCPSGQVFDCDGSGDCHPEFWIGDGYADCEDQAYGADLSCYDNDGGYCSSGEADDGFSCGYSFGLTHVTIEVGGGSFPWEVSWSLVGEGYSGVIGSVEACLEDGCYTFNMLDSYGDGWNGNTVTITTAEGTVLLTGTLESGSEGSLEFCVSSTVGTGDVGTGDVGTGNACPPGKVLDCDGSGDCHSQSWIGDGSCDDPDQAYGADLSCYDNDGGDCGGSFGCGEGLTTVLIEVGGGSFPWEVSWSLDEYHGEVGSAEFCLSEGCHTFIMKDSFGDGWNGNTVTITTAEGTVLLTGTLESGSEGSLDFGIGDCDNAGGGDDNEWWSPFGWWRSESSTKKEDAVESPIELLVYYNSTNNLLTLEIPNYSRQKMDYQLYDVLGNLLDEHKVTGVRTSISMDNLSSALYLLKVSTSEKEVVKTFKIVKN